MKHLGFKYEAQKKGYYVDGHEKPATVEYRWSFVQRYLSYERRMFRWIQIPLLEALKLEEDGKVPKHTGYWYQDSTTGDAIVEYHVDACTIFQEQMNETTKFGGRLSVRKEQELNHYSYLGMMSVFSNSLHLPRKHG